MGTRQARIARRTIRKNKEQVVREYLTLIQGCRLKDRLRFAWYIVAKIQEKPNRERR